MKHVAILKTESEDAKNIARALDIDNIDLDEIRIKTKLDKNKVVTEVHSGKINTLLTTLDDIISCQMTAEKVIR